MLGHRQLSFEDYKAILLRKWWIALITVCVGPLVGYGVSRVVPKLYTSQTLLAIQGPNVADAVANYDAGAYLASRLSAMEQRVFGEESLQPLVQELGLVPSSPSQQPSVGKGQGPQPDYKTGATQDGAQRHQMESAIAGFRKAVTLAWAQSPVSTGDKDFPGFYINCEFRSAELAQQACADVASLLIDENKREQQQDLLITNAFLDGELKDAKRKLDDQEARMAIFKETHSGELPEAQADPTVLSMLSSLQLELEQTSQAQRRAEEEQAYTQSRLDQEIEAWRTSMSTTTNTRPDALEQRLADVEKTLIDLRARYTEKYPEISKLKAQEAELKTEIQAFDSATSQKNGETSRLEPPGIQQLRNQLHTYQEEVQDGALQQKRTEERIKVYESRLAVSPAAEQEYRQVTRDYQTAQDFYNDLLKRKNQTVIAGDLEHRRKDEEIVIVNAATLPDEPSSPNAPMFVLAGLGAGAALGLGLILLLEMRDKSLRTESDVELLLHLPVAVAVPELETTEFAGWRYLEPANGGERMQGLHLKP